VGRTRHDLLPHPVSGIRMPKVGDVIGVASWGDPVGTEIPNIPIPGWSTMFDRYTVRCRVNSPSELEVIDVKEKP
jgi:hypothetical protein